MDVNSTSQQHPLIGIRSAACRMPGDVLDHKDFWQLLKTGLNPSTRIPATRIHERDNLIEGNSYGARVEGGNFIKEDIGQFDAAFFRISRSEAEMIDPQQRILLECVQECIENGGVRDCKGTGVFVGLMEKEYEEMTMSKNILSMLGSMASVIAGRVNYIFDCYGPSLTVDTACSSSLVALDVAIASLLSNRCSQAIVAGVNLILSEKGQAVRANGKMLSADGLSASFDERASGYGRSDGCACLLVEIAQPDREYLCYIRATSVNHCGRGVSLTTPNGEAHKILLNDLFISSGIDKCSLDYWEAHGTGTSRGDPIEFNALASSMSSIPIGTVKSSFGHGEAAAGVTGLLKLCLLLQHDYIPPQLHLNLLNRKIYSDSLYLPFVGQEEDAQLVGLSSFGVSGTNAAALAVKPAKVKRELRPIHRLFVLPLSAKSQKSLDVLEKRIAWMLRASDIPIGDVAATLAHCRIHSQYRTILIVDKYGQVIKKINGNIVENQSSNKRIMLRIINEADFHPNILSIDGIQRNFSEISNFDEINNEAVLLYSCIKFIMNLCDEIDIITESVPIQLAYSLAKNSVSIPSAQLSQLNVYSGISISAKATMYNRIDFMTMNNDLSLDAFSLLSIFDLISYLFVNGSPINWDLIYASPSSPIFLPNYQFSRQSYWFAERTEIFDHYLVGTQIERSNNEECQIIRYRNFLCSWRHSNLFHGKSLEIGSAFEVASIALSHSTSSRTYAIQNMTTHLVTLTTVAWLEVELKSVDKDCWKIIAKIDESIWFECEATSSNSIFEQELNHHKFQALKETKEAIENGSKVILLENHPNSIVKILERAAYVDCSHEPSPYPTLFAVVQLLDGMNVESVTAQFLFDLLPQFYVITKIENNYRIHEIISYQGEKIANIISKDSKETPRFLSDSQQVSEDKCHFLDETEIETQACYDDKTAAIESIIQKLICALSEVLVEPLVNSSSQSSEYITVSFDQLGLDSLSSIDFVHRLTSIHFPSLSLSLTDIFEYPNIVHLAQRVAELMKSHTDLSEIHSILSTKMLSHSEENNSTPSMDVPSDDNTESSNDYFEDILKYQRSTEIVETKIRRTNSDIREKIYLALSDVLIEELQMSDANDNKNFFELGLDSLGAVDFVNRLNEKYVVNETKHILTISDLFDYPTISELTEYLLETLDKYESSRKVSEEIDIILPECSIKKCDDETLDNAYVLTSIVNASENVLNARDLKIRFNTALNTFSIEDNDGNEIGNTSLQSSKYNNSEIILHVFIDLSEYEMESQQDDIRLFEYFLQFSRYVLKLKCSVEVGVSQRESRANHAIRAFMKTLAVEKYPKFKYIWQEKLQKVKLTKNNTGKKIRGKWMITGGLTGIGLEAAKLLAREDVEAIVLVGRRKPSDQASSDIELMRKSTQVFLIHEDICNEEKMRIAYKNLPFKVTGLIHSAGCIRDASLERQTIDSLSQVYQPKMEGLRVIERIIETEGHTLNNCICMSSFTVVAGNFGQLNYAYVNALMEFEMSRRHCSGLSGVCVQWGNWLDVGMAAPPSVRHRLVSKGLIGLQPAEALEYLKFAIISNNIDRMAVAKIDWGKFLSSRIDLSASILFDETIDISAIIPFNSIEEEIYHKSHKLTSNSSTTTTKSCNDDEKISSNLCSLLAMNIFYDDEISLNEQKQVLSEYPDDRLQLLNNLKKDGNYCIPLIAASAEELRRKLANYQFSDGRLTNLIRKTVLIFPGQGAQYPSMGLELSEIFPRFGTIYRHCLDIASSFMGSEDLGEIVNDTAKYELLNNTSIAQPMIFSFGYAMAQLWREFGVKPDYLLGHSVGELVAGVVAGVISLEDGLRLVVERGKAMENARGRGAMLAVSREAAQPLVTQFDIHISAINSKRQIVISGEKSAIEKARLHLLQLGHSSSYVNDEYPFHCPLITEKDLHSFRLLCRSISFKKASIPIMSTLTGSVIYEFSENYLVNQIVSTVRFSDCITELQSLNVGCWLECGPSSMLISFVRTVVNNYDDIALLPSADEKEDSLSVWLKSALELERFGHKINWRSIYCGTNLKEKLTDTEHEISLDFPISKKCKLTQEEIAMLSNHCIDDKPVICGTFLIYRVYHWLEGEFEIQESNEQIILRNIKFTQQWNLDKETNEYEMHYKHDLSVDIVVGNRVVFNAQVEREKYDATRRNNMNINFEATPFEAEQFYNELSSLGLQYSNEFRLINSGITNENACKCTLRGTLIPWVQMDATLHAILRVCLTQYHDRFYIPFTINQTYVNIQRIQRVSKMRDSINSTRFVWAKKHSLNEKVLQLECRLIDSEDGEILFEIIGGTAIAIEKKFEKKSLSNFQNNHVTSDYEKNEISAASSDKIDLIGYSIRARNNCSNSTTSWDSIKSNCFTSKLKYRKHTSDSYLIDEDIENWDPLYFGLTPTEAKFIDPQQKLLLKSVVEAQRMSGITKFPQNTGVFIAAGHNDFENRIFAETTELTAQMGTGTSRASLAGRISHFLHLTGPSILYDTACSSSFVALIEACEQLLRGAIECAIVGSVNLILHDMVTSVLKCSNLISTSCRPFAVDAAGFVRGEAVCCVVLSSHAVVAVPIVQLSAWKINHNGGKTNALQVPSGKLEEKAMKEVSGHIRVEHIECHGTGTHIGDAVELEAVTRLESNRELRISSIKGMTGHCEASSGLVSLVSMIEQMKRGYGIAQTGLDLPIPAARSASFNINFVGVEQNIDKCIINNFGLTGTNCSLLIENASHQISRNTIGLISPKLFYLVTLSAKSQSSLNSIYGDFVEFVRDSHYSLESICRKTYRLEHFQYRAAIIYNYKRKIIWSSKEVFQISNQITESEEFGSMLLMGKNYCEGKNIDFSEDDEIRGEQWQWQIVLPEYVYEELRCWPFDNKMIKTSNSSLFYKRMLVEMPKSQSIDSTMRRIFSLNKIPQLYAWEKCVLLHLNEKIQKCAIENSNLIYFIEEGREKDQFFEIIKYWKYLSTRDAQRVMLVVVCEANQTSHTEWTALLKSLAAERRINYKFISYETESQLILEAFDSGDQFETIFYRNSIRYVERLVEIEMDELRRETAEIENAVFTGGRGGIANVIREKIRPAKNIVFTRNARQTRTKERCIDPNVYHLTYEDYERNAQKLPQLSQNDCFIHCAGNTANARIEAINERNLETVLEPKVEVLHRLRQLVQTAPRVVGISSAAAILGSVGQANYAFANGLMTSHLERLEARNGIVRQVRTVHLGPVEDVGMLSGDELMPIRKQIKDGGWEFLNRYDVEACFDYQFREIIVFRGDFANIIKNQPHLKLFLSKVVGNESNSSDKVEIEAKNLKQIFYETTGIDMMTDGEMRFTPFMDLGIDSLMLEQLRSCINLNLKTDLSIVDLFNLSSYEKLENYLKENSMNLLLENQKLLNYRVENSTSNNNNSNIVAIIGRSGIVSGCENADKLFEALLNGQQLITRNDANRAFGKLPNNVEIYFDHKFFGITHEEAQSIDPQIRLFVQCAYNALETTKYVKQRNELRIGCFAGAEPSNYCTRNSSSNFMQSMFNMNMQSHIASYTAHALDLRGLAVSTYSACSTSLVAIIQACQALQLGQLDLAIAGAASVALEDDYESTSLQPQSDHLISPSGVCRPFDEKGDGIVRGSGVGCVVLKRHEDAVRDNDAILAVIKAYGMSNDGKEKASYMAPNTRGQFECMDEAIQKLSSEDRKRIGYVECHATGTKIGDEIEMEAIREAYGGKRQLRIGSVKANIGHCFAAAGIVGVFKAIDMLKTRKIPPQINFEKMRKVNDDTIIVNKKIEELERNALIGVSAFGIGGTNAHIILEAGDTEDTNQVVGKNPNEQPICLLLSAKTEQSMNLKIAEVQNYYYKKGMDIKTFCNTMQNYRELFPYRIAISRWSEKEVFEKLAEIKIKNSQALSKKNICFYFCPQGVEYKNMYREMFKREETQFGKTIRRLFETVKRVTGFDYEEIIYGESDNNAKLVENCMHSQLIAFVISASIVEQLAEWGIEAETCIGHSVGEYAAAWWAGVIPEDDLIKLLAERSRLVHSTKPAKLVAIEGNPKEYEGRINKRKVELSAILSNILHCYTGEPSEIEQLIEDLQMDNIRLKELKTERGFHSSMMDPILDEFEEFVSSSIQLKEGATKTWVSSMDGRIRSKLSPKYCKEHMRQAVDMQKALDCVHKMKDIRIIVEIGPSGVLTRLLKQRNSHLEHLVTVPSRSQFSSAVNSLSLFDCRDSLWSLGYPVKYEEFEECANIYDAKNDPLAPVYQFEKIKCWKSSNMMKEVKEDQMEKSLDSEISRISNESKNSTELITNVFREQLGQSNISAMGDFFAAGGDSLSALEVVWKLNKLLSINISTDDLFNHPTAHLLSNFLESKEKQIKCPVFNEPSSSHEEKFEIISGPLTYAQQQIFMQNSIQPGFHNNIIFYAKLPSIACESSIVRAIEMLCEYQPGLRTTFTSDQQNTHPMSEKITSKILINGNLSNFSSELFDEEAIIDKLLHNEKNVTFDLSDFPFRILIVRLSSSIVLFFNLHHILIDGWSISLLAKQFAAFYEYCKCGTSLHVERLQNDALIRCALNEQQLGIDDTLINELVDKFSKKQITQLPITQYSKCEAECKFLKVTSLRKTPRSVVELMRKYSATKYVVYLSAFLRAISNLICSDELLIGTAHSGRNELNRELITYAMNNHLLDAQIAEGESLEETIVKVSKAIRNNRKFEKVPYHLVASELNRILGRSGNIFEAYFNYRHKLDFPLVSIEGMNVEIEQISINEFFPFSFTIDEMQEGDMFRVMVEYDSTKYSRGMINDIVHDFEAELHYGKRREIHELCGQRMEYPEVSITNMLLNHSYDENILALDGTLRMNYAEFWMSVYERTNYLEQAVLLKYGETIKSDDVIALETDMNDVASLVAVLLAGAAFAPIDPSVSEERKQNIYQNIEPRYIWRAEDVERSKKFRLRDKPLNRNHSSDLCYVIHTSGSTGEPKGVAVEHGSLATFVRTATRQTCIRAGTRVAHSVNTLFDVSIANIFLSLANSATLVLYDSLTTLMLSDFSKDATQNVNFMFLTSAIFNSLNKLQIENCTYLEKLFVGGESIADANLRLALQNDIDLTQIYGPAEACIWSLTNRCKMSRGEGTIIGVPVENETVWIENGKREGKLVIRGRKIARGYCRTRESRAVAFEGQFLTSDVVRYESGEKKMRFIERSEEFMKIRGTLVRREEIERNIKEVDNEIKEIHLLKKNESLVCLLAPKKSDDNMQQLKDELSQRLNSWSLPNVFMSVDSLPKNKNGKLDKHAMEKMCEQHLMERLKRGGSDVQLKMRSTVEIGLEKVIRSVLPLTCAQIDLSNSSFASLGGHSLLAASFSAALSQEFSLSIPISDIFECVTLRLLARRIGERLKSQFTTTTNSSIIVKLRGDHDASFNIYLIHAIGGTIFPYYPLLQIFPKCVGIYGIEYDTTYEAETIKDLAEFYAKAIIVHTGAIRPYLIGHSLGGILSREIACELEIYGQQIPFVIMIDSWLLSKNELDVEQVRKFAEKVFCTLPNSAERVEGAIRLARMLKEYDSGYSDKRLVLFKAKQIGDAAFRNSVRPQMTEELSRTLTCNGFSRVASNIQVQLIEGDHQTCLHIENIKSVQTQLLSLFETYF